MFLSRLLMAQNIEARDYYEFQEYVYIILGVAFGATFLALLFLVVRQLLGKRTSSSGGLDFGDLEKMAHSSKLSPEEIKKIRQAYTRRFMQNEDEPPVTLADLQIQATLAAEDTSPAPTPSPTGKQPAAPPKDPNSPGPDLTDLAKEGKISDEEFERLKKFFEQKGKERD